MSVKVPKNYDPAVWERILKELRLENEQLRQELLIQRAASLDNEAISSLKDLRLYIKKDANQINIDAGVKVDGRMHRFAMVTDGSTGATGGQAPSDAQYVVTAADADLPNADVLTATANQTTVSNGVVGTVQNIATSSTPQFARIGLGAAAHASLAINAIRGALIDGSADEAQLTIQGHSTQTNSLLVLEDSAGNDQVTVSNDGAVIINEEGNAADFRVESDGDANCLHVNGTNNTTQVGASSASDSAKFYVNGKLSTSGETEINGDLNHDGSNIGFYGVTPAARPSAYSITNGTTDRAMDCNATTLDEIADLIFTLQGDLTSQGLSQ
jgi:hypothetical protein